MPDGRAQADGAWSAIPPPSGRYGHSAVYDPVNDRIVIFGGYDGHERNDLWALDLSPSPQWSRLIAGGTRPYPRYAHSALYDPLRERMIVVGSDEDDRPEPGWALPFTGSLAWAELPASGSGPQLAEYAAVYDSAGDRVVVFGGRNVAGTQPVYDDEVWVLTLTGTPSWSSLSVGGPAPPGRWRHSAIYDPVRRRMIVYGGADSAAFGDVWALSLDGTPSWLQIAGAGTPPSARTDHAAVYDPAGDRMIVFGGDDGALENDVWALTLGDSPTWTQLLPSGTPPSPRHRHAAVYDPVRGRMFVIGGSDPNRENDVFALSLDDSPAWSEYAPQGTPPSARVAHSAVYDPQRDAMLIFGGTEGGDAGRNDTRMLSLAGTPKWAGLSPLGTLPPPRSNHLGFFDPLRERMIVCGGYETGYSSAVFSLDLSGTPEWNAVIPSGPIPPGRIWDAGIFDPRRTRLIVYGGYAGFPTVYGDTWTLKLDGAPAWAQLLTMGAPPVQYGHTAVYDPLRDRMVVVGGTSGETWQLFLSGEPTWEPLETSGTPPAMPLQGQVMIYDPIRDRIVVYGGAPTRSESWQLTLGDTPAWSQLQPGGLPAPGLRASSAVYDPIRDRLIVFGGDDGEFANGTWALEWNEPAAPSAACSDVAEAWQAGADLHVPFQLGQPLDGPRAVEWTLTSERDWPSFPMHGITAVGAGAPETLRVAVPVPDSVAAGFNTLTLRVSLAGAAGNDRTCQSRIQGAATPALASLVSATAEKDRVRIVWYVAGGAEVAVERRRGDGVWTEIRRALADGRGTITVEDGDVVPGARYGYRLRWPGAPGRVAGETWVDVPATARLALEGARPNPARGDFAIAFTLARAGWVGLEVYDLGGRRVARRALDRSAGFHVEPAGIEGAAPGLYVIRLHAGGQTLEKRAILIR